MKILCLNKKKPLMYKHYVDYEKICCNCSDYDTCPEREGYSSSVVISYTALGLAVAVAVFGIVLLNELFN